MSAFFRLAVRPALFALDPETAHNVTLFALRHGFARGPGKPATSERLRQTLLGLDFPNPLGLAAGFDKNADVPDAVLRLGFGFAECGTVTPQPQPGNPKPRIFRLAEDEAVINRLGFNNKGHEAAHRRLAARGASGGVVGINIGANKDAADRVADYVAGYRRLAALARYVTVNISSPNTPGLRGLQNPGELDDLLGRVAEARRETGIGRPILLKIAPDLDAAAITAIVETCIAHGIDGLIVSNTTITRPETLRSAHAKETGGLSGRPLFHPATRALAQAFLAAKGRLPLIGAGGVATAEDAFRKIAAGARLVQLYTAMVYRGPGLPAEICAGLDRLLAESNLPIAQLCGRDAARLADESPTA
ncbi:MAG: quinone-dependent dihydroorotate dehydrogenase [Alphaproteobacteria bacterium]|nr:quinone-dependent dihydroorotate dehydrogenase [Alphaproteobacteria bacterium]